MTDQARLAAGTITSFATDLTTPVYTVIPGIMSFGPSGYTAPAKDRTTLADTEMKYGSGLPDAPDKTIKGQYYGDDTDQKAFIAACRARTPMLLKCQFPDKPDATGTGTVVTVELQPLGFEIDDPTGAEWLMFTVTAKQNSFDLVPPVAGV